PFFNLDEEIIFSEFNPIHNEDLDSTSKNDRFDTESYLLKSPSPIPVEDSDSLMEEIYLSFNPDDPMPSGIEEDDDDSKRDILILEELLDNYSLSLPVIESYPFDIPSFSRPLAKLPDGNTGILNETILEIERAFEDKHCQPEDILELFQRLHNDVQDIHEELAVYINTPSWDCPTICYNDDDDEDYTIAITPKEPDNSLSMGDEHLDTISVMESEEFIKFSVENLVPNPSESEGEHRYDVPACNDFTTFSNILFDADDDFSSSDDQSFYDEDFLKEIYSNPLFDEEIISMKIDPHHFNAYDSFMEEIDLSFTPDDPMPPSIEEDDYDSERDILILKELLSNDSLSLPKNKSFHFDILSSSRPPAWDGILGF
nr:hypothetical protein [Tanacetum cinerariifolium]